MLKHFPLGQEMGSDDAEKTRQINNKQSIAQKQIQVCFRPDR